MNTICPGITLLSKKHYKNRHEMMKGKRREIQINNISRSTGNFNLPYNIIATSAQFSENSCVRSHKLEWNLICSNNSSKILFPLQFCITTIRCYFCNVRMKQNASKRVTEPLPRLEKFNESWSFFWSNSSLEMVEALQILWAICRPKTIYVFRITSDL